MRTHIPPERITSIPTERTFLKQGTPTANIHCTTLRRTKKEKETPQHRVNTREIKYERRNQKKKRTT